MGSNPSLPETLTFLHLVSPTNTAAQHSPAARDLQRAPEPQQRAPGPWWCGRAARKWEYTGAKPVPSKQRYLLPPRCRLAKTCRGTPADTLIPDGTFGSAFLSEFVMLTLVEPSLAYKTLVWMQFASFTQRANMLSMQNSLGRSLRIRLLAWQPPKIQ
jgi:hypothetical protein